MSFDLQNVRDISATNVAMTRQHAIFREAERSDRKVSKARNIADLLERGHRPSKSGSLHGVVVDVKV
jgi:hypothetical protein